MLVKVQMQVLVMLPPPSAAALLQCQVLWQQGTLMKRSCIFLWILFALRNA